MSLLSLIRSIFYGGSPSTSESPINTSASEPNEPCTSCDRKDTQSPCTNTNGCVMESPAQEQQKELPDFEEVVEEAIPDPVPPPPPAMEQPDDEGWVARVSQWLKYERRYRLGLPNCKTTVVIGLDKVNDEMVVLELEYVRISMTREQAKRLARKLADPEL